MGMIDGTVEQHHEGGKIILHIDGCRYEAAHMFHGGEELIGIPMRGETRMFSMRRRGATVTPFSMA